MAKQVYKRVFGRLLLLVLVGLLPFVASVQATVRADVGTRVVHQLDSRLMGRKMPYEVIRPAGYESGKEKFPAVYLLHGLTGHSNDWLDKSKLMEYALAYRYVIVMPEGDNGWYSDSPVAKNGKYESYIVEELIPEVEKLYRVKRTRDSRAIAGLSMGGYGALKFGLKYPEKFVLAGSFSGALRAVEWDENTFPAFRVLGESVNSAFGAKGSPSRESNDIFKIASGVTPAQISSLPFLYIDCGTEDGLIVQNREFTDVLMKNKVAHEFRQLPGRHDWPYWDSQVQEFLLLSRRFLK
ncbi:MAG: esterase family protein [Acidobacteriota bacterium]|nr:esterase family protein [Acidobacteriota bacterium]